MHWENMEQILLAYGLPKETVDTIMILYKTIYFFQLMVTLITYRIYPTPPLGQDMTQGQFFKTEFKRFEFRLFLLLD